MIRHILCRLGLKKVCVPDIGNDYHNTVKRQSEQQLRLARLKWVQYQAELQDRKKHVD